MTAPPFDPDPRQVLVLAHSGGPLLVTGAAGTGKTAVLRERFARLIEGGADPERVALLVGSARAKDESRAWLLGRLPASLPGLHVLTIHGLANRVLRDRSETLGIEPPAVLSAAEHFAKVRELLANEEPGQWPTYGALLGMRGFADEVRQFLSRAQEALLSPEDIEASATARELVGWPELARFLGLYQAVLDDLNAVDFAALLQRAAVAAGEGEPPFDHVMVDDYQDSTPAAEAILIGIRAPDLVVAANEQAHVFSFQGTSAEPLRRFTTAAFSGASTIELETRHRAPEGPVVTAWVAPHTSEEHAAIARELRRLHVEDAVGWSELAVVVRRTGAHVSSLLRALDDAQVPRAVPERGLSLTSEPATLPYVLALRWLVAEDARRQELVEQLLVSDVVGLSPGAARGLLRQAQHERGSVAHALDVTEGLSGPEAEAVLAVRDVLAKAALFAGMSVQDAFRILWEELPCSRRLVEEAGASSEGRRELDTVVTFANVIAEHGGEADASVQAFLESLDAGEQGPGYSAWERSRPDAVRVLTAHGAAGQEFDTVLVAGAVEGNFPSLHRPEPMFDLALLDGSRSRSQRTRERLEDERRLFGLVLGRARRRVVLVCADSHPDTDELSRRTRFAAEAGVGTWMPVPSGPFEEPVSLTEAAAGWRMQLADRSADAWRRLAALEGLVALGVDPARWWFQRDWTDTGRSLHDEVRVSYSRLSNLEACELMHVLGDELGLGRPGGYHAWVGKTVHTIVEEVEKGLIPKDAKAIVATVDARWRPQEFPSLAVSAAFHRLARERILRNWFQTYGDKPALGIERGFEFELEGATVSGYIDRIGPSLQGGTVITDFKTGKSDRAEKPNESLQLGIYYLAVQESEDLAEFKPVSMVELAYLRGSWRDDSRPDFRKWPIHDRDEEGWQAAMRERLAGLIHRKRELDEAGVYRPNPYANCRFCDFQTLCPLFAEGQSIFPVGSIRRETVKEDAAP